MISSKHSHLEGYEADAEFVTLCAWTRTVRYEGEWISVESYLARRYGIVTSHGMSPAAQQMLKAEEKTTDAAVSQEEQTTAVHSALHSPRRLAAVKATALINSTPTKSFDRLTRIGARLLGAPVTFISLVDEDRDVYLSHCGFGEPLASERQLAGKTFCHYTIESESPLVIADTRAHPVYANVPTVNSLGVAAYLGAPLVLLSGEVVGAFCAIDFVPRAWTDTQIQDVVDLASLVVTEIESRHMTIRTQIDISDR